MSDTRRMTTDRFYGGLSNRLDNLHAMLAYVRDEHPTRDQLRSWVLSNTKANSEDAVSHHLSFLNSIDLITLSDTETRLSEYGQAWLTDEDPETLYDALSAGVKGFDTILNALAEESMTDQELMELLVSEFEEAEMTTPGPAIRHREWLQVLGYVARDTDGNHLTDDGRALINEMDQSSDSQSAAGDLSVPSTALSVGDQLSPTEIEDAFETGFGYQISGINPRRDDQDRRYVLVFATEDGPYADSVSGGRFEYVGEGLEGDQSETSPGNSTLIDAISSAIPVHFFYQDAGGGQWRYEGLVDVLGYEREQRDGREVLVFTIERHSEATSPDAEGSADEDLSWLEATRLEVTRYRAHTGDSIFELSEFYAFSEQRLSERWPDNNNVRAKIRQQVQALRDEGDLVEIDGQGTYRIEIDEEPSGAQSDLEEALDSEPELTEEASEYTVSQRRRRDHAFSRLVRDAYDQACAICGSDRETPHGHPEVEAAHIYPKEEDGVDDVRNGIALCKLHHWAFDTGWLSITDDWTVLVRDATDTPGYHEFKQLEGDSLTLPDDAEKRPHPMFLQKHRELHGFE